MPENYSKRNFIIQQQLFENVYPMTQASCKTWMMFMALVSATRQRGLSITKLGGFSSPFS